MSVKNEGGFSLLPTDARGYALGIYVRLFPLTGSTIYTNNTKRHYPGSCVLRSGAESSFEPDIRFGSGVLWVGFGIRVGLRVRCWRNVLREARSD